MESDTRRHYHGSFFYYRSIDGFQMMDDGTPKIDNKDKQIKAKAQRQRQRQRGNQPFTSTTKQLKPISPFPIRTMYRTRAQPSSESTQVFMNKNSSTMQTRKERAGKLRF